MRERVSPALAAAEVVTEQGEPFRLSEAWASRTAVLAFLRHFG